MNINKRFLDATENNLMLSNRTILEDTSGFESITVQNCRVEGLSQAPLNNVYTNLLAGRTIDILPNSELLPNSILDVGELGINCNAPITLATTEQISSICNGSEYQNQKILAKKERVEEMSNTNKNTELNFLIYPNPAQENVQILLENAASYPAELVVTVVDVSGNPVRSATVESIKINGSKYPVSLEGLAAGMYIIQIDSDALSGQRKIVKL